ncbi:unnamed protein product, partial [Owenia fusiformis]
HKYTFCVPRWSYSTMMPQGTISVATLFILVIKVYEGYATYYPVPPPQSCSYWGSWIDVPGQCNPPPGCTKISKREIEDPVNKRSSPVRCTMTNYPCKVKRTCQRCGYYKRSGGTGGSCSRVEYKTVNRLMCCRTYPPPPPPPPPPPTTPPRPTCYWKPWGGYTKYGRCVEKGPSTQQCYKPGISTCYRIRQCHCTVPGYRGPGYCSGSSKEYKTKPCCLPP